MASTKDRLSPEAFRSAWADGKGERDAALAAARELADPEESNAAIDAARARWAELKAELLARQPAEG